MNKSNLNDDLIVFLSTISYFKTLPMSVINSLATQFKSTLILSGEILIQEGDKGDCLYIVQSGRLLALKKSKEQSDEVLGDICRGELIGELALFTEAPRAATVIAIRDSILWKLSKKYFDQFVHSNPLHIMPMVKAAMLRLIHPEKKRAEEIKTIALVPSGHYPLNKKFINDLVKEFKSKETTIYINSTIVRSLFPEIDLQADNLKNITHSKVTNWLNEQELCHKHIIYEVDIENSNWTKLCLRQADKIVLIGDNQDSPKLNEIEKCLFNTPRKTPLRVDLILLHEANIKIPSNTQLWLQHRLVSVYHLKKDNIYDIQRMVRLLIGRDIALVLGGGGAKSLAQLGVYKALCELGIPIDRVGGTSMGSLIAAAIAMNHSFETMLDMLKKYIVFNRRFNTYTLPIVALLNGVGWINSLKKAYGETIYIEDLWKNFFCITSNLTTRKMDVLEKGLLYRAVRASTSLPGIVPPISNEHHELQIDGGIFNNLPVDIMRSMTPKGQIIAIRVAPFSDIRANIPEGIALGTKLFFTRFNRTAPPPLPGIAEIIAGAITLCNDKNELHMLANADHSLDLDLKKFSVLGFKKFDAIIETGYREAIEQFTKNPILVP
jgi:predicted acylesterase/phospholipase RssA/CRP-like cAMP-binding protein